MRFGFDTNADLSSDVNAVFEAYGSSDPESGYITIDGDDADRSGTGHGGSFFLRGPADLGPSLAAQTASFLISYSGLLPSSASGEIWDLDAMEQWRIDAFNSSNSLISSQNTPVGQGTATGGPLDGRPYTFSFNNLGDAIATIRMTLISHEPGVANIGFAFDNFNATQPAAVPEPSNFTVALVGMALAGIFAAHRDRGKART